MLVETVNVCEIGPQIMTYSSLTLPPRMLAVINVHVFLKVNSTEHIYEVKPNSLLKEQYPNMVIIPVIHITPMQTDTIVPFIVSNLSIKPIFLSKCEMLGFLELVDAGICEITTISAMEPLASEVMAEHPKNPLTYREGQFICSPADISLHRKVDLQDAEVSENIQEQFQKLCSRYTQVFFQVT